MNMSQETCKRELMEKFEKKSYKKIKTKHLSISTRTFSGTLYRQIRIKKETKTKSVLLEM